MQRLALIAGALLLAGFAARGKSDGADGGEAGAVVDTTLADILPFMTPDDSATVQQALNDANVQAFLAMIRAAEGTAGPDGYRMFFGGGLFDSYTDHPRQKITRLSNGKPITSSASGAYQILQPTWDHVIQPRLHLPDFSPASQDAAAVELLRLNGSYDRLVAGDFDGAVTKAAQTWASLPGSPYGQPLRSLAWVTDRFVSAGGALA